MNILSMTIDGLSVYITKFKNLKEFLKINDSHYVLKYDIDENSSFYYSLIDSEHFTIIIYCIDKNFPEDYVKLDKGVLVGTNEISTTSIALSNVVNDLLFETVIKIFELDKK